MRTISPLKHFIHSLNVSVGMPFTNPLGTHHPLYPFSHLPHPAHIERFRRDAVHKSVVPPQSVVRHPLVVTRENRSRKDRCI